MIPSQNLKKILGLVLMCALGFAIGYGVVRLFVKNDLSDIQNQPAPLLPK